MRVVINLIVVSVISLVLSCDKEGDPAVKNYFIKYYGLDGDQRGADLVVNPDGTMMILGTTEFSDTSRIYLIKVDEDGDIIWEKELGENSENAKDIEPIIAGTHIGGYLILSNVTLDPVAAGNTVIKVIRVDSDGNKQDSIKVDNNYLPSNYGSSVTPLSDGGFIVTGNTKDITVLPGDNTLPDPFDQTDLLTLRYFDNLTIDPVFPLPSGGEPEGMGVKMIEISLNEFYFAGYSNTTLSGEAQAPPSNFDFNFWFYSQVIIAGDINEHFSGNPTPSQEKLSAITKTPFGEYFAVGTESLTQQIIVSRIASDFSISNAPVTFPDFEGEGIAVAPSGGSDILILGNYISSGGSRDIWLTKVSRTFSDKGGFPITFGAAGNDDRASAVAELPNGDIVVLGTMNLENQDKIALIKLKASGGF